jgi:hypothetical protein
MQRLYHSLFQKDDKKERFNYRPVSLMTTFSKVFEKVIYIRLYQHLINHSVLVNELFGFKATTISIFVVTPAFCG